MATLKEVNKAIKKIYSKKKKKAIKFCMHTQTQKY